MSPSARDAAPAERRSLAPELCWTGSGFERDVRVTLAGGRIAAVTHSAHEDEARVESLPGRALLPGFVNGHSHSFQRGLRGRGERFPAGAGSFWSWREEMYTLVDALDEERLCELTARAYREMLRAGITTVGEFHYLHHAGNQLDFALDRAILRAARETGVRLVLLEAYYATGAIGQPLGTAQRRFATPTPHAYFQQLDALGAELAPDTQSLGCVVHSIRAASLQDLAAVHDGARERGHVLHMHVDEQPREIEDCVAAYGRTPTQVLCDELRLDDGFTAVHCTHTPVDQLERLLATGAGICICPLTEANLGDGLAFVDAMHAAGGRVSVGSDSNARIDMLEELRWLEYGQRLERQRRGVLVDAAGQVAASLIRAGTRAGAQSLGIPAGSIEPGFLADFVLVDLEAAALKGWSDDTLAEQLLFGAGSEALVGTCVDGRWVVGP